MPRNRRTGSPKSPNTDANANAQADAHADAHAATSSRAFKPDHSATDRTPRHAELHDVADRLHSIAIHLLRRLRKVDESTGLSGPRLSALSVVVFAGPVTLTELAAAEQVRPPTMTRLVQALEEGGYVVRNPDPLDGRISRIEASAKGRALLMQGRRNRVEMLAGLLAELSAAEQKALRSAVGSLEAIVAGRRAPLR